MNSQELAEVINRHLIAAGMRHYVDGIEPSEATDGEVILWPYGKPVYSVREAREFVWRLVEQEADI